MSTVPSAQHNQPSQRQPTPLRWRGLAEPTMSRPQAPRRMSGLDAMEYRAMAIPKSSNAYIIPPLRNESPKDDYMPPPVKRARLLEQDDETKPVKRPHKDDDDATSKVSTAFGKLRLSTEPPEKKRVRFGSLESAVVSDQGGIYGNHSNNKTTKEEPSQEPSDDITQTEKTTTTKDGRFEDTVVSEQGGKENQSNNKTTQEEPSQDPSEDTQAETTTTTKNGQFEDAVVSEQGRSDNQSNIKTTKEEPSQEPSDDITQAETTTTTTHYVAVDTTNMTFDSLICKRLKELCEEYEIDVPSGTKKKATFVSLLETALSPRDIIQEEPYTSFTKEALETKCRDRDLSDSGSKAKLVERLEAFSASD